MVEHRNIYLNHKQQNNPLDEEIVVVDVDQRRNTIDPVMRLNWMIAERV